MAENENKNGEQDEWKAPEDEKLSPEQKEQGEPIRKEYEYRDSEGNLLGRAFVELDPKETGLTKKTLSGKEGSGKQIRSLKLQNPQGTEVDLLAIANEHNISVFMADERLENYYYENSACAVPPLETQTDIAVFLHELGHASQDHEKRFEGIIRASKEFDPSSLSLEELASEIQGISELIDYGRLDQENFSELVEEYRSAKTIRKNAQDEIFKCTDDLKKAREVMLRGYGDKNKSEEYETAKKRTKELSERLDVLEDISNDKWAETNRLRIQIDSAFGIPEDIARQIKRAPSKILERDATRGALEWLKRLQAMGVDLLKKYRIKKDLTLASKFKKATDCLGSVTSGLESGAFEEEDVETSVLKELKAALESYKSEEVRVKTPQGKRVALKAQPK